MLSSAPEPTVFILSFRHRDALRDAAARGGWRTIAARRGTGADQRFLASGARVAVVDTRGERDAGMDALRELGPAIEQNRAALLALIDAGDVGAAREAYAAGATHFWPGALDGESFDLLLRLSLRHSERARGPVAFRSAPQIGEQSWRWERGSSSVELSPALARQAGFGDEGGKRVSLMELFRKLDGDGRRAARNAVERLRQSGEATAFAHSAGAGAERLAHHVGITGGAIVGQVETLGATAQRSLDADLAEAIERGEIGTLFQPQVKIAGGRVVGVEALARWRHPRLGEVDAATLFDVAERSGLLLRLSQHVQLDVMKTVAGWPDALARLRVAINVTSVDIAEPGFADRFIAALDAHGIARRRVTVEITESGLIEDLASAARLLADLRAQGLRVAIDDFGTGYSSLAYLKALPLDYLKIDKQMSQDIEGSARDRVVVRGVIDMARSLGLAVIAEGVETERQLTLLAAEGCNYYQGYLYAPALTSEALAELLGPAVAA